MAGELHKMVLWLTLLFSSLILCTVSLCGILALQVQLALFEASLRLVRGLILRSAVSVLNAASVGRCEQQSPVFMWATFYRHQHTALVGLCWQDEPGSVLQGLCVEIPMNYVQHKFMGTHFFWEEAQFNEYSMPLVFLPSFCRSMRGGLSLSWCSRGTQGLHHSQLSARIYPDWLMLLFHFVGHPVNKPCKSRELGFCGT